MEQTTLYALFDETINDDGLNKWMKGTRAIDKITGQILVASLTTDGIEGNYDIFLGLYRYMFHREKGDDVKNIGTITYKWRPLGNPGDFYLFPLWLGGRRVARTDRNYRATAYEHTESKRYRQVAKYLFTDELYEYLINNIPSTRDHVNTDNELLIENDTVPLAIALGLAILDYTGTNNDENISLASIITGQGKYTGDKFLNVSIPRLNKNISNYFNSYIQEFFDLKEDIDIAGIDKNNVLNTATIEQLREIIKLMESVRVFQPPGELIIRDAEQAVLTPTLLKDLKIKFKIEDASNIPIGVEVYYSEEDDQRVNCVVRSVNEDGSVNILLPSSDVIMNADPRNIEYPGSPGLLSLHVEGGAINKRRKTKRKINKRKTNKRKTYNRKSNKRKRNKKRTNKRNTNKRRN